MTQNFEFVCSFAQVKSKLKTFHFCLNQTQFAKIDSVDILFYIILTKVWQF